MFRTHHGTTTQRNTRPTFWTRLKGPNARTRTYKTEETTYNTGHRHHGAGYGGTTTTSKTAPPRTTGAGMTTHHHHHRRRPSIGDRVSGAMLKLKGSLTRRPGVKAAGTRRMRGTDGRGSRNRYAY
ncbi:hypothetical protein DTO021D3_7083 [Paecilomyces variotii]|nr:hypothetical protein DTO032I3_5253 [Paecilomyces variotii]KAJ9276040.1 hypothetical protein DTO021D3_7083 [Paecilomyces variotii]KAJ9288357.1 hypothetical protein DTO021C3_4135 [Paecilomyces variotii]KAJ9342236.1 hypothetical protein DTO027B6_5165 [Paecilomyces variotii]KAJ9375918.1 hypothetical protein DTO032I4_8800 [Paecilomyces variotii]